MEKYIAIDNVCAWPNLTRMPDGAIIATIFNQPTHGGWEGDVECWASEDEGRMWQLRGTPAPHQPGTNRMNVAAGLANDDSLVVIASGWSRRNPPGEYSPAHDGEVLAPWVCRCRDGGSTWERTESVEPLPGNASIVPFGDVVRLGEGRLGVFFYDSAVSGGCRPHYFSSDDDGYTWRRKATIDASGLNETAPVLLQDGRLLAVARTVPSLGLVLQAYASDDGGITWDPKGAVSDGKQVPGHLLQLRDGRVLMTYGLRNRGLHGVAAKVSKDRGETWSDPRVLVNYDPRVLINYGALQDGGYIARMESGLGKKRDGGGYPSSVESADGTIVTAYYCQEIPCHQRYHMGVLRWQVDGE